MLGVFIIIIYYHQALNLHFFFPIAVEHHLLRVTSDEIFSFADNENVVMNNGRLCPIIVQESEPCQGTKFRSFQLTPLEKNKVVNQSTIISPLLDLPARNQSGISIDSGIRSCGGLEMESPQPQEMPIISSKCSSIVTSVFVKQAPVYPEEFDSVLSLDNKTVDDKNHLVRKRSFSGHSSNTDASKRTLQTDSSKIENTDDQIPSLSCRSVEEGKEVVVIEDKINDDDDDGIVNIIPPKGWLKIIAYILLLPLIVLLFFTLPNVKKLVSYLLPHFLLFYFHHLFIYYSDGSVSFHMSLLVAFCGLGCFPTLWCGGQQSSVIPLTSLPL